MVNSPLMSLCEGFEPPAKEGFKVSAQIDGGPAVEMEYLGLVKHAAQDYGVFFPSGLVEGDSGQIVFMRLVDDGGEGKGDLTFQTIDEDQDLVKRLFEIFKKHTADIYDFAD